MQTIVRGSGSSQQRLTNRRQTSTPSKVSDNCPYSSQNQLAQIPRNLHLDRLYHVKPSDPSIDSCKPSVPNYQNELINSLNGKIKQATSPVLVTTREKIDGSTKLSLEDVRSKEL